MFIKSLRALLASAFIIGPALPASAQTNQFGPEKTLYVYCKWMKSGDTERAITPPEQITWRDTVNVYDDGRQFISQHIGSYLSSLEDEFEKRVGRGADCTWSERATYDYESEQPGVASQVVGGWMVTMVLEKVDPSWFLIDRFSDNIKIASLGDRRKFAKSKPEQTAVQEARKPEEKGPSAAEIAAKERAARAAEREAEFQRKQADYETKLAEQKRQVDEFNQANSDIARKKAEQVAAVKAAEDAFRREQEAHAELMRQHEAEVAKYESELAASKVRADFDKRHGLGKASTDTDANRCVTTAETKLNDTFKGNTSASIINGCGQPVDVRICLMTDKGWNCGVRWGVGSQAQASFSAFNATGQVFVDAKITGSDKALASPN